MLFATKGLFAKDLYVRGMGVEALVAIRAVLAVPLFWGFALAREGVQSVTGSRPASIAAAAFAGVLCYYGGALLDFYALTMIDASVERVLMFTYPAFVVVFTATLARRLPSVRIVLAVAIAYLGIYLAVGGLDHTALRTNALGAGLVILSAITYAIYFMIGARYTRELGSSKFTLYAMSSAALALALHFLARHPVAELAAIDARSWWIMVLLATLVMFVPALMQAEGVRRIGAQRAAVVSSLGPPTTILLAWLLLGERMSAWQLTGVALIVGGILVLDLTRGAKPAPPAAE